MVRVMWNKVIVFPENSSWHLIKLLIWKKISHIGETSHVAWMRKMWQSLTKWDEFCPRFIWWENIFSLNTYHTPHAKVLIFTIFLDLPGTLCWSHTFILKTLYLRQYASIKTISKIKTDCHNDSFILMLTLQQNCYYQNNHWLSVV